MSVNLLERTKFADHAPNGAVVMGFNAVNVEVPSSYARPGQFRLAPLQ